ncbi:MAG: VanZ family protein [Gemmataceae bacterium]|nr:VanZ family protein [Gemmataceae bacterium]
MTKDGTPGPPLVIGGSFVPGHSPEGAPRPPLASEPPPGLSSGGPPVFRWAVFLGLLGLWTWKLLQPQPVPEELKEGLAAFQLDFLAAKSLHAGGYALLTVLAGTLVPGRWWRVGAVAFMALHGVGTEIGQLYVPNRTGTVRDVLIDWAGVAAGAVVLRWFDRRPA